MKFSLRPEFVCLACLLCFGSRCPAYAVPPPQEGSQSAGEHKEASENHLSRSMSSDTVTIPGPLRSFLRMTGISQQTPPNEVLPILARNVSILGYREGKETEYLVLVNRYMHMARELQSIAKANGEIHITGCGDAGPLISVLGYKFQGTCGEKKSSLVTENAERAFLTIDSGFPLTELERSLQKNAAFTYPYPATAVPIYFKESDWSGISKRPQNSGGNLLDLLLHDQGVDRLYWALSKCDRETRLALQQAPGLRKLYPVVSVFDLYGSGIVVHSGSVVVPGGAKKEWEELVGASPNSPGDFVSNLLTKDHGWLAEYFDVLSRLSLSQQSHLAEGNRLKRFYQAYRSTTPHTQAGVGVFPRNAQLLILLTSLKWDAKGNPQILQSLSAWPEILARKTKSNPTHEWPKQSRRCDTPERFLEMLVASSNLAIETGPIEIFLMLETINAGRPPDQQLSDATEELIANRISQFDLWFSIFAEFPTLDDTSIAKFVSAADRVDGISNPVLRANSLGAFQGSIGLWQILARQGQIPNAQLNSSWLSTVQPFLGVSSSVQVFRSSPKSLAIPDECGGGQYKSLPGSDR